MKILNFTLLTILLLFGTSVTNAQTGSSVTDAITVDMSTSPVVVTGVNSQNSTSTVASGMQGGCPDMATKVIVYKVIIPSEGSFYASYTSTGLPNNNKSAMILFSGNNPTDWSDLTLFDDNDGFVNGNVCSNGDSIYIGRRYKRWSIVPHWSSDLSLSTMPAGTYYVLFFNYTSLVSVAPSDITFEFISYCTGAQPDIAAEGNSTNISDGDDTPSSGDNTDYGATSLGAGTISKTFTIKNVDGVTPLNISAVNITGTNAANFSVTTSPVGAVATNSSTTMTVEFTPNTIGENTATIEIASDDCFKSNFTFDLKAYVTAVQPSNVRGNMLTLDGTDDYVEINNVAEKMVGVESFTFEAWVNADALQSGNDNMIAVNQANGDNRILFYLDDGVLETYVASSGNVYTNGALYSDLGDGLWHHLAYTHDGSTNINSVYLDGQLVETESRAVTDFLATDLWSIGQEYDNGSGSSTPTGDYFQGKFDEVRIWKDVRTQAEIQSYKNLTFTIDQIKTFSNLVAYYQFDNDAATGTVDGVKDILGNHGTAINGGVYSASEVAVGNGIVERQAINAAGTADFSTLGIELEFITSGGESVPNGDLVITKITTETPNTAAIGKLTNEPTTYWVINNYGTNTNLNCNVKFKFDDGEISDAVIANHKIHKRGSNDFIAGAWLDLTPTSVSATAGDNHIKVNVNSFSQFSASSSTSDFQSALPIELTSFTGRETNKGVSLNWETAVEINNQGFEIQHSINSREWSNIGYKTGAGSTTNVQHYEFLDASPLAGINYYRLKQVDFDGKFDYSPIVSVTIKASKQKTLKIYPNPVKNELIVEEGQGIITIYNIMGQFVRVINNDDVQKIINVSDLPTGQYLLRLQKENGEVITRRFVK